MIKLTGIEKLFLILNEDKIVRNCSKRTCSECPMLKLANYRFDILKIRGKIWPCLWISPTITVVNRAEVIKALRKFIKEIGK